MTLDDLIDVAARASYTARAVLLHLHWRGECLSGGCTWCESRWAQLLDDDRDRCKKEVRPIVEALAPLLEAAKRRAERAEARNAALRNALIALKAWTDSDHVMDAHGERQYKDTCALVEAALAAQETP